jgi:predicted AAA+ superfamily ATPase
LIETRIREALLDAPVVLISEPRQAGKTNLVRHMAGATVRCVTFDNAASLPSARRDFEGLVKGLSSAVIDEIQRAPELLFAIKKSVDQERRRADFAFG